MRRKKKIGRTYSAKKMGRRAFVRLTGLGLGSLVVGCARQEKKVELKASKIIPGKIPEAMPGKLVMKWADEAMIREAAELHPFDLQGRMKMAVNAMTTCLDPNLGYITYAPISFQTRPPHMHHALGDFADDMGRHTDSLWMIRSAIQDRNNDEIVHKFPENAMAIVNQGIAWNPPELPFTNWWIEDPNNRPKERFAHLPEVTRVILGLMSYYRASGDQRALNTVRSMVRGFYEVAEKNDKYLWYPDYNYEQVGSSILPMRVVHGAWSKYPTGKTEGHIDVKDPRASGTGDMGGNFPAVFMGMMLLPVLRYYDDTKDPLAAELVTKFSHLIVDLMPDFAKNIGHTHSSLATVSGIFRAGQVFGIAEFKNWAEDIYQKFVALDYIPNFGWTPESTGRPRVKGRLCCEACTTTDYIEVALQLAQYRNEKYWDDVERIAMNQLLEGQILHTDFVERIPEAAKESLPNMDPKWLTTDHVLERSLGGFGILSGPNDWIQMGEGANTLQCCFGSGPRSLYDAWYYAAQEDTDTVRVNLQFSKRLPSALVTSAMPGKAMLEIQMTQGKKLLVRKPGWANAAQTKILLNGKERKAKLAGTYFDLGPLQAGTTVRIEFPNQTTRKKEKIGEVEFTNVWRGNAVVEMQPAGEIYPLYQHRDRRDGVTPLPFVSTTPINPL